VDAEQAEDVWAHTAEAADRAWVEARLDGDRDQACGVRAEADAARADSATASSVEDRAENLADIMGADAMGAGMEIVIDRCEYVKNNCCE
jgi:hypothetical protein